MNTPMRCALIIGCLVLLAGVIVLIVGGALWVLDPATNQELGKKLLMIGGIIVGTDLIITPIIYFVLALIVGSNPFSNQEKRDSLMKYQR